MSAHRRVKAGISGSKSGVPVAKILASRNIPGMYDRQSAISEEDEKGRVPFTDCVFPRSLMEAQIKREPVSDIIHVTYV